MILINNGSNPFRCNGFTLQKGVKTQVPDNIAEEFLKIKGVEKYIAPADVEKVKAKAVEAIAELEAENAELKAEIEALKAEKAKADEAIAELEAENAELKAEIEALKAEKAKADEAIALEAAKAEAEALGISFPANIGLAKLLEKIEAAKANQ